MKHRINKYPEACSIGIIGGADGPTAVYCAHRVRPVALAFTVGALFGVALSFFAALSVHKKKNG